MQLKSVTITNMHNIYGSKVYNFGNINYLHGPNGAGKSTILQAIQFALLGYIPGTNKKLSDIFTHCNSNYMNVQLDIEDEGKTVQVIRKLRNQGNTVKQELIISPEMDISELIKNVELPIFNFTEFINMTPNKLKDWFLKFLPTQDKDMQVNKLLNSVELPEPVESIKQNTIIEIEQYCTNSTINCIEDINTLNKFIKELISTTKAKHSMLTDTLKSLVYYNDFDSTVTLEQLQNKKTTLQNTIQTYKAATIVQERNNGVYAQIRSLGKLCDSLEDDPNYTDCIAKIEELSNQKDKLCEEQRIIYEEVNKEHTLQASLRNILECNICPYTMDACDTLNKYKEECQIKYDASIATYENLNNRNTQIAGQLQSVLEQLHTLNTTCESIRKEYATLYRLQSMILPAENLNTIDIDVLEAQLKHVEEEIIKHAANDRYTQLYDKLFTEKCELDIKLLYLKEFEKLTGVNGVQTEFAKLPFKELSNRMTNMLSDILVTPITATFVVDAKSNGFSFGITREEQYIPYNLLSSGEKCIYAFALLCAVVSMDTSNLKVLIMDDMLDHLDSIYISKLFEYMGNVQNSVQMIIAGVLPCNNKNINLIEIEG